MTRQDSPHPTPPRSSEAPSESEEASEGQAPGTIDIDMDEALRRIRVGNEAWEKRALELASQRKRRMLLWSAGILLLTLALAAYLI